jgi:CRP/FNR family cyclic AMP-dependent transcriptional regulator
MAVDLALLSDVPIFRLLDQYERATLAALLERRTCAAGETIFHQGEPGDEIFLVSEGRVEVYIDSDVGDKIILAENTRGDVFGEISLLDGGPRTAAAVALEPTEVLTLDRERLLDLVQKHPHVALDLLTVMGQRLRGTDEVLRSRAARNPNVEEEDSMTFGERIADRVAAFGGSWTFIGIFGFFLVGWIILNSWILAKKPIDPFPYILLNLFLSMIAALQAPVIMMSQNRQSTKDRLKADLDYEVNLKSELEVAQLHRKLDHLTERFEAATARPRNTTGSGVFTS